MATSSLTLINNIWFKLHWKALSWLLIQVADITYHLYKLYFDIKRPLEVKQASSISIAPDSLATPFQHLYWHCFWQVFGLVVQSAFHHSMIDFTLLPRKFVSNLNWTATPVTRSAWRVIICSVPSVSPLQTG